MLLIFDNDEAFALHHFFKHNIDGLISTSATYQELKSAITAIGIKRQKYVSPPLISSIKFLHNDVTPFSSLSKKEMDVAYLLLNGNRNSDIAERLNISRKTVSTYKTRIFRKLDLKSDAQLFMYAYENNSYQKLH